MLHRLHYGSVADQWFRYFDLLMALFYGTSSDGLPIDVSRLSEYSRVEACFNFRDLSRELAQQAQRLNIDGGAFLSVVAKELQDPDVESYLLSITQDQWASLLQLACKVAEAQLSFEDELASAVQQYTEQSSTVESTNTQRICNDSDEWEESWLDNICVNRTNWSIRNDKSGKAVTLTRTQWGRFELMHTTRKDGVNRGEFPALFTVKQSSVDGAIGQFNDAITEVGIQLSSDNAGNWKLTPIVDEPNS